MFKMLRSIVVEPHPDSRVRLRDALRAICIKSNLTSVASVPEFFRVAKESDPFQVVFISSAIVDSYDGSLIEDLKKQELPNEPLLVLSIKGEHRESGTIASLYLDGYDGFICDPFSAEDLLELIQATVAHRVNEESIKQKQALVSFLAGDAARQLDSYAAGLRVDQHAAHARDSFRNVGKMLGKTFEDIDEAVFASILLAKFKDAKPFVSRQKSKKEQVLPELAHPGELLATILEKRGIALDQFKEKSTLDGETIDSFVQGKVPVDAELATEISRVLGSEETQWEQLQALYDKQQAEKS